MVWHLARLVVTILQNNSKNYSKTNHKSKTINQYTKKMYPGRRLAKNIANVRAVSCVPEIQLLAPVALRFQEFLYPLRLASLCLKKEVI